MPFNPLNYPLCFAKPQRLTDVTSWHEHIPFAFTIVQILEPKLFVELGTHKGDSYCAFCQAVEALMLDTACYAIDKWEGDEHSGFYGPDILADLKAYHDPRYNEFSQLIKSSFDDALDYFSDKSIDLLHIDGLHTYEAVKHDFEMWLPKMSKKGVVLFHDTNVFEREFGVWKFWEEICGKYPSFEFKHGHGLGILAVGEEVPDDLLTFLGMSENENITLRSFYASQGEKIKLERKVQAFDKHFKGMNETLQEKEMQIHELNGILQEKDVQIHELNGIIQGKDVQIHVLNEIIPEKDLQISGLNKILQEKDMQIIELDGNLQSIHQSIVWHIVTKFHNGFVEPMLPHGTRRRKTYDLGLKGGRILVCEGWSNFWWNYKNYKNYKYTKNKMRSSITSSHKLNIKSVDFLEDVNVLDEKVSIIIPTKNAGTDFEYTLEKIRNQKGIKEIELLVIDSGSTDATLDLAEKYGARVFRIKPEDFQHGKTRNFGAEKATGSYLLFTVQDAIPIGEYWLNQILEVLKSDDNIAAASCKQVPRSDADSFACYTLLGHNNFMDYDDRVIHTKREIFDKMSFEEKRKIAGLDNVCCCIKKDVFEKFKFRDISYAEDLDLGIRLARSGYSLAFLKSVAVIHSHTRSAHYFIRRYYVDNKSMFEIFDIEPSIKKLDLDTILNASISLYASLKWSIYTIDSRYGNNIDNHHFISALIDLIGKGLPSQNQYVDGEPQLDELITELGEICDVEPVNNRYLHYYYTHLIDTFNADSKQLLQRCDRSELISLLYKIYAMCCGSTFGDLYFFHKNEEKMQNIDALLRRGV